MNIWKFLNVIGTDLKSKHQNCSISVNIFRLPVHTFCNSLFSLDNSCLYLHFRKLKHFYDTISPFQSSPVYQLRHLVAPVCVAMVTVTKMGATLMSYVDEDLSEGKNTDMNTVHGKLLFVCSGLPVLKRCHCYFRPYFCLYGLTIIQDVGFLKVLQFVVNKDVSSLTPVPTKAGWVCTQNKFHSSCWVRLLNWWLFLCGLLGMSICCHIQQQQQYFFCYHTWSYVELDHQGTKTWPWPPQVIYTDWAV